MSYGPELKRHRKLVQTYIGTVASMKWIEAVERLESGRLILRILNEPTNFIQHVRTSVTQCTLILYLNSSPDKIGLPDIAHPLY